MKIIRYFFLILFGCSLIHVLWLLVFPNVTFSADNAFSSNYELSELHKSDFISQYRMALVPFLLAALFTFTAWIISKQPKVSLLVGSGGALISFYLVYPLLSQAEGFTMKQKAIQLLSDQSYYPHILWIVVHIAGSICAAIVAAKILTRSAFVSPAS
ncbi:hypothetical protein Rhal01_02618 [Rubritalea halochordaticola]|uniref:DUF1772 domain-containing protein n=1 Tax=Rubritalea halochordaticola TaxID=714537 RepID=A0ABP9V343_9BACT